jgi:hypothetical protein
MRVVHFLGELTSGVVLMLFVPVAALAVGIPIVLLARLLIALIERL